MTVFIDWKDLVLVGFLAACFALYLAGRIVSWWNRRTGDHRE